MNAPPRRAPLPMALSLLLTLVAAGWPSDSVAQTAGLTLTPESAQTNEGPVQPSVPAGCEGAIVDDDGTVESGYGWVPSVVEGVYVQEYSNQEVTSGLLRSVCVCWLRTRNDDTIDFDVVLYRDNPAEGVPEMEPYAVFPAQVSGLPLGIPGATFTEVDLDDAWVAPGRVFVGVRWNANVDQFFFACVDKSDGPGPPTRVYYRDDRTPDGAWGVSDMTNDSTFDDHRAMFIRPVVAAPQPVAIPLGRTVPVALTLSLLLVGGLALRRL